MEEQPQKVAEVIHGERRKWFILENDNSPYIRKNKGGSSRRPAEIRKIRKYKKWLRSWWLKTKPNEKEGLKMLYEEVKKSLRNTIRMERHLIKKRKKLKSKVLQKWSLPNMDSFCCSLLRTFKLPVTEQVFLEQKASFFSYWRLLTTFECFSLLAYKL